MNGSLVSCVLPVFNGERYLEEALQSVFAQTYRPIEVVVVDDGSTDSTAAIAAAHGDRVLVLQQANAGPSPATNRGIKAARGELLAFLDADDRWPPQKLALQAEHLAAHPDIAVVFAHARNFWIPELRQEEARYAGHRITRPLPAYTRGTMMARRSAFDAVGGFDPGMAHGEVQEWVLKARATGLRIELLPDTLLERRLHPGNRSRQMQGDSREEFLRLIKRKLDRTRDR
jgi:glycosyltransferase involved in cell wall biosynthesis